MKKQVISVLAAVASVAAVASTVESANIFGVMKVDVGTATSARDVLISVPWVTVGAATTATTVCPTNLVATTGLGEAKMFYFDGTTWYSWTKNENDTVWTSAVVSTGKNSYSAGGETTATLGNAIFVNTAAQYIYLNGQYSTASVDAVTLVNATTEDEKVTPGYTLIASKSASTALNLNDNIWTGTPDASDTIMIDFDTVYKRLPDASDNNTVKWGKVTYTSKTVTNPNNTTSTINVATGTSFDNIVIPAGRGAWYVRRATSGVLSVSL